MILNEVDAGIQYKLTIWRALSLQNGKSQKKNSKWIQAFEDQIKVLISSNPGYYIGPLVLAWAFDFGICGVIIGQFLFWSSTSKTDRLFVKIIVYWVGIACLVSTIWGVYLIFWHFALQFGVYSIFISLDKLGWYTIFDAAVTVPVLIFYIERAFRLHKNRIWVPLLVAPCLLLSTIGAIGSKVMATDGKAQTGELVPDQGDQDTYIYLSQTFYFLWLGGLLAADVLVTILILWGLYKNRSGWSSTDKLIYRLMGLTAEAQLPGTIVAITNVALASALDSSPLNTFFQVVHPKFYAMTLLALLNSRVSIQRGLDSTQTYVQKTPTRSPHADDHERPWQRTRDETDEEVASDGQGFQLHVYPPTSLNRA